MNTKVRRILIIALITAVISFFAVILFATINLSQNKRHKTPSAADGYIFGVSGSEIFNSNEDYNYVNNSKFYIGNSKAVHQFAMSVANGCNFMGKTVELTADITRSYTEAEGNLYIGIGQGYKTALHTQGKEMYDNGVTSRPFCGTFDGKGFTISNMTITATDHALIDRYKLNGETCVDTALTEHMCGFFAALGMDAKVQNLKLKDMKITVNQFEPYWDDYIFIGGIVGMVFANTVDAEVQIFNCEVDGLTIEKGTGSGNLVERIGGIMGGHYAYKSDAYVAISDCCITNFNSSVWDDKTWIEYDHLDNLIGAIVGYMEEDYGYINNCVINGDNSKCVKNEKDEYYSASNVTVHYDTKFEYINGLQKWGLSEYETVFDENSVFINKSDSYDVLDVSNIGGVAGYESGSNTIWYCAEGYHDGYPRLRQFLDWKDVVITANNTSYVLSPTLNKTVKIPTDADANNSGNISTDKQTAKAIILGREIELKPKGKYQFVRWECSATLCTVYLEKMTCTVTFSPGSVIKYMVNPNLESIEIAPGATVSLEVDLRRNTYSYVINSEGIEYFVEYLLDGDLKAYTIGDWGIEDGATITEDLNIMPTFKPKEYGWVIV